LKTDVIIKNICQKYKKNHYQKNPPSSTSFAAWKYFDGAPPRNYSISPTRLGETRISLAKAQPVASTITPSSKLDIHHKNQYNRANHSSANHIYNNNNNNNRLGSSSYQNPQLPSSHIDQSHHNADDLAYHSHHHHPSTSVSPTRSSSYNSSYNRSSAILNNQSNSSYYSNSRYLSDTLDPFVDEQTVGDSRRFTERRKKTVRFDGQELDDFSRWESERQESQDSTTKDSGIDTSSTFTSSEDSNRGDGPKV
jgi:hypothetical protein